MRCSLPSTSTTGGPRSGLVAETRGSGPPVVLVHGVGVGPESFGPLSGLLERHATVTIVHRPGYGRAAPGGNVELVDQVGALVDLLGELADGPGGSATLVGVSGGATLALHLLATGGGPLRAAVLHEPLVGALAPALHHRVRTAAANVDEGFVADLVGPDTWSALPAPWRDAARRNHPLVRAEVPAFAALDLGVPQLAACGRDQVRIITTVGERSGPERHEAARVLVTRSGAQCHVIPGAGHLAHVDAPEAFAAVVRSAVASPDTGGRR